MKSDECAKLILEVLPKTMLFVRSEMRDCAKSKSALTVPQFRVLVRLSQADATNAEIAEWMGVSAPTMTRMIDQLARRKLVNRITQVQDRRQVKLSMTDSGKDLFEYIREDMRGRMTLKIDVLTEVQRKTLVKGLNVLSEIFTLSLMIAATFSFMPLSVAFAGPSVKTDQGSNFTYDFNSNFNKALTTGEATKSLRDAYTAAIKRSETINIQEELLVQANEGASQAVGAVLPSVNTSFGFLRQEAPTNATGNAIYPATQNSGKITLDQPLFRGFREFAALRQKKFLVESQVSAYLNAAKQLFYDTSTAYYNVLISERDVMNYGIEIELNQKRLKELEDFFKIGRAQLTDVLTFKANIASLEAQLETSRGLNEVAKESLAYLTGWSRGTDLKDTEVLPAPVSIDLYLNKIEGRADVQAALTNVQAYEEGVPIAWGGHLPSVDLLGDYYFFRPGALSSVDWDVQLAITFPIFQGGVIQSQVRQARSVSRQYSQLLSQTRRLAEQEVRIYYDTVEAERKQILKLTELVDISKKNYETEIEYYRHGLVTNLDVFQAITTYRDAVRQLDHIRFQCQSDGVKLQASTGQRSELSEIKAPRP